MKKFQLFFVNYKFLILNSLIILYFIINFYDGNRGYISLQNKIIEYDKLSNIEKILKIESRRLKNENISLTKNIDTNFLDEIYRYIFVKGKKNERLLIIK